MNFTESTESFIKEADWLTAVDDPAICTLIELAKVIDRDLKNYEVKAPIITAYGLTYRNLLARAPRDVKEEENAVGQFLKAAGK